MVRNIVQRYTLKESNEQDFGVGEDIVGHWVDRPDNSRFDIVGRTGNAI